MQIHQHRLSTQGWLALLALILSAWFMIDNLAMLLELTWILFSAFILGVMIRPIADRLVQWRIPRGLTVFIAYILLLIGMSLIFRLVMPVVSEEASILRQTVPTMTKQTMDQVATTPLAQWLPPTDSLAQELTNQFDTIFLGALKTVTGLGAFLLDLFVTLIIAYFLVTASLDEEHQIWLWLHPMHRKHLRTIFLNTYRRLNRWVWTQLILSLYHGVVFVIGLLLLQVPFALTIGLLGGLLSLIPYLGVIMATLLAALSVLPNDPWLALWVVLFMTAVTIVAGHVLTPVLYGRAVGLNSLIVLIALFVGAHLQGILGMIFAIPVAVIIDTVLQELTFAPQSVASVDGDAANLGSAPESSSTYEQ